VPVGEKDEAGGDLEAGGDHCDPDPGIPVLMAPIDRHDRRHQGPDRPQITQINRHDRRDRPVLGSELGVLRKNLSGLTVLPGLSALPKA